jgi:hypothetical protein
MAECPERSSAEVDRFAIEFGGQYIHDRGSLVGSPTIGRQRLMYP